MLVQIIQTFRFLGDFRVSLRSGLSDADEVEANLCEIFAVGSEGDNWNAFARFSVVPDNATGFPDKADVLPEPADNVFLGNANESIRDRLKEATDPVSFWICNPKKVDPETEDGDIKRGPRLRIYGLSMLDQFEPGQDVPNERFLSVDYATISDRRYASSLVFGHARSQQLRVEPSFLTQAGTLRRRDVGMWPMLFTFHTDAPRADTLVTVDEARVGHNFDGIGAYTSVEARARIGQHSLLSSSGWKAKPQKWLPDTRNLSREFGLSKEMFRPIANPLRIQVFSRRVADNHTYAVAISRRARLRDGVLPLERQFGFPATADDKVDLQTIWTVPLTDATILDAYFAQRALAASSVDREDLEASAKLEGKVTHILRFSDEAKLIEGKFGQEDAPGKGDNLQAVGLNEIARASATSREALVTTDRQPQTILPDVFVKGEPDAILLRFVGYAKPEKRAIPFGTAVLAAVHRDLLPDLSLTLDHKRHIGSSTELDTQIENLLRIHRVRPLEIELALPGFSDTGDRYPVLFEYDRRARDGGGAPAPLSIVITQVLSETALSARLGSVQMERSGSLLAPPVQEKLPHSYLQARRRAWPEPQSGKHGRPVLDIEWQLGIALDSAIPVTSDVAHGDRAERPADLLIAESRTSDGALRGAAGETPALRLDINARLQDDHDPHLIANLIDLSPDSRGPQTFSLLTLQPWQALRFTQLPFTAAGGATSDPVAVYDSDRRDWRLLKAAETYRYTLPAAAVGEDADKPGEVEIVDPHDRAVIRPAEPRQGGAMRRRAVDMRLSPPSTIWVEPSDLERNYFLAQANARDLFRQRGDFGTGVAFNAAVTELIYGIATGIKAAEATALRAKPRLISSAALSGEMIQARQNDTGGALGRRWPVLRRALTDHAEELSVVRIDTSRPDPFQPVRFTEGVTGVLRRTALLRAPAGLEPSDIRPPVDTHPQPPRFADHGLAGGALWPIESANIARAVAENPVAFDAEVSDLTFSPLGTSGNQAMRFVNGLVTVISQTTNGRLHRQRVEVLGRIGVLYHRAKHVVIYERTTAASAQFAPTGDPQRSARPILRKVEEFVEILQPKRSYPDDAETPARTRGSLEEARFNSLTIHVNAAWGRELEDFGWEVPLWNRAAAARRPQVYPFPEMAFIQTAEGDIAAPQVAQDCLDMANLRFVVDVKTAKDQAGGVDTDLWPARQHVDYGPMCDELLLGDMLDDLQKKPAGRASRRPAASRFLPGMRRYTWRVAPSPTRVQINATRGDKPIFAGVESVSLSRHPGAYGENADPKGVRDAVKGLGAVTQTLLPKTLEYPLTLDVVKKRVPQVEVLETALGALSSPPNDAEIDALKAAADAVISPANWGRPEDVFSQSLTQAKTLWDAGDAKEIIGKVLITDATDCEALAKTATDALLRRRMLLSRQIREAVTDALAWLDALPDPLPDEIERQLRAKLQQLVQEATGQVVADLGEGVLTVRKALADAQAIVTDWRDQARQALTRSQTRVTALRRRFDNSKPWSENRMAKALAQVAEAFDAAAAEIDAALMETRQRFASELDAQGRALGARVAVAMQQITAAEGQALGALSTVGDNVNGTAGMLLSQLERIPDTTETDAIVAKLRKMADGVGGEYKDRFEEAVTAAEGLVGDMQSFRARATPAIETARDDAEKKLASFKGDIKAVTDAAIAGLSDVEAKVADFEDKLKALDGAESAAFREIAAELRAQTLGTLRGFADSILTELAGEFAVVDQAITRAEVWTRDQIDMLDRVVLRGHRAAQGWIDEVSEALDQAERDLPAAAEEALMSMIVDPLLRQVFDTANWPNVSETDAFRDTARQTLIALAEEAEEALEDIQTFAMDGIAGAEELCKQVMGFKQQLVANAESAGAAVTAALSDTFGSLPAAIDDLKQNADALEVVKKQVEKLLGTSVQISNELVEAADHAQAYMHRGLDILDDFDDARPRQMPGLALKFLSAATTSPEVAALQANADRIRVLMKEADEAIKTPELRGAFDQLGDALKALGLDFDFDEFADDLKIKPPSGDFLRDLLPDFGGINLKDMLPTAKLPGGLSDAVKVTHDLDIKAGRAWVQADVNLPMPGREKMFSIGPFTLYLRRSLLKAQVRAEADKDSDEVVTTDSASLKTTLEAVVSGQVMVTLEDVVIRYSSRTNLDFDIDPKKIKIHKSLQFVQDTIGSIFGDDAGGLKFIKESGVPVGVEHQFAMPPLSLMYGTSGVSNIQIANRFSLRAYPDFVIANRFNLSRTELPFLFTFFIIGGTGYLQVDTDYRPFDNQLMVVAEAGAGGSAALGFAFGPVNGNVFISLSVVLRYQKRLGGPALPDDGLSVSLLLVIAGSVSLFGIVTVYLGLRLSISYRESGQVDGLGSLSVEVRISRFFKLRYSAQITYKLRDGKSTTQVEEKTDVSGQAMDAVNKAKALNEARKSL